MTETMEIPLTLTDNTRFPAYEIAQAVPPSPRKPAAVHPALVEDLRLSMGTRQPLAFPIEGLDDKQVTRLAARLNALGRRASADFTVRTRRNGDRLYAWAVQKQVKAPRKAKE